MRQKLAHIFRLGLKELTSLRHDTVLLLFLLYAFSVAIYMPAAGSVIGVHNASVAIVDEDHSLVSRKLGEALYGRMTAYEGPLRQGDPEALAQALARNVYGADAAEHAGALARYALAARTGLGAQDFNAVLARPAWGDV